VGGCWCAQLFIALFGDFVGACDFFVFQDGATAAADSMAE
jgi:hypothetical protein